MEPWHGRKGFRYHLAAPKVIIQRVASVDTKSAHQETGTPAPHIPKSPPPPKPPKYTSNKSPLLSLRAITHPEHSHPYVPKQKQISSDHLYRCHHLIDLFSLGETVPPPSQEPGRFALFRETGFASCGRGVLGISLLVVEVGEFLGGIA